MGIIAVAIVSTMFAIVMDEIGVTGWIMERIENASRG